MLSIACTHKQMIAVAFGILNNASGYISNFHRLSIACTCKQLLAVEFGIFNLNIQLGI